MKLAAPTNRIEDQELKGIVRVFDGVLDMTREGCRMGTAGGMDPNYANQGTRGIGRHFGSWAEVEAAVVTPDDPELTHLTNMMTEKLKTQIAPPESVRRRQRWDARSGSLSVERAVAGGREMFRRTVRESRSAVQTVTIVCNAVNPWNWTTDEIFWRGAATVAAVDLLEAAGYSCEVWTYVFTTDAFWGGRDYFCGCRAKAAGDVLDVPGLIVACSAWLFRTVGFSLIKNDRAGAKRGLGHCQTTCGKFTRYVDPAPGTEPVYVPVTNTEAGAAKAAAEMIEKATEE